MIKKIFFGVVALTLIALVSMSFLPDNDVVIADEATTLVAEDLGVCDCPPNFYLEYEHPFGKNFDKNDDGYICYKILVKGNDKGYAKGHGNDKEFWDLIVHKDNNKPCYYDD